MNVHKYHATPHHDWLHLIDTNRTRGGRALFELARDFEYRLSLNGGGLVVRVPAGFVTDFASIPRSLSWLLSPTGPWRRAAVIHDYLYTRAAHCPRFLADAVFRHLMEAERIPARKRLAIYYAVRIFGRPAYQVK